MIQSMSWLQLIVAALAVYRVARMIAAEDGPFDVFTKLRHKFGIEKQETWIQRGFSCIACMSVWGCLIIVVLYANGLVTPVLEYIFIALALSSVNVILMRRVA